MTPQTERYGRKWRIRYGTYCGEYAYLVERKGWFFWDTEARCHTKQAARRILDEMREAE